MIVAFSLSALWWRMIRSLWKLPDGRDWLREILGPVLMGRAMLSKSLIHPSTENWIKKLILFNIYPFLHTVFPVFNPPATYLFCFLNINFSRIVGLWTIEFFLLLTMILKPFFSHIGQSPHSHKCKFIFTEYIFCLLS